MLNFVEMTVVGDSLFHADRRTDGRTDMTKQIVTFSNSRKGLKPM